MMTQVYAENSARHTRRASWGVGLLCLLWSMVAHAILDVQITQGIEGEIPIAVVPFAWTGPGQGPAEDVGRIIAADLQRTGRFKLIDEKDFLERPKHGGEVRFDNWRVLGAENLVVGRVQPAERGGYLVQFQLFDVFRGAAGGARTGGQGKQLVGYNLPTRKGRLRATAHFISDIIYEQLTGEKGAFSTRIAYITATGRDKARRYTLEVADSDGHNPIEVLRSSQPIMSPAWSPDGRSLAYVSFQNERPEIFIHDLASGQPRKITSYKGINGAPAWSPDGRKLALTLSRGHAGNPEIHVLDLKSRSLRRITYNSAIDTEPVWWPDGRTLIFTSDRSGAPQLYRVPVNGGRAKRLTFEGNYNARASISQDGKYIAMVNRDQGVFKIGVLEMDNNLFRVLTDGNLDESPSFAPNGSMILYANSQGNRGELAAVSVDGRVRQRLVSQGGDVREPAWGPFIER